MTICKEPGICKLPATWLVPDGVHLAFTERCGGVSLAPFASLNLGLHVGDEAAAVLQNRQALQFELGLPAEPRWLNQVHGTDVCPLDDNGSKDVLPDADASYTARAGQVCVVMTADCLPVLFASLDGKQVAAAHAGWRGLCEGVLEATLARFTCSTANVIAYLGPAIGPAAFEVGAEVREAFLEKAGDDKAQTQACFVAKANGKYLADLVELAAIRLRAAGVSMIFAEGSCTFTEAERFFSYRRSRVTGRMASLIWRD